MNRQEELLSVIDFVRYANTVFNNENVFVGHGACDYWDEAIFMVLGYLSIPFDKFDLCKDARLTDQEKFSIHQIISTRVQERKPTAYLINKSWFCGLEFYVDDRVIIPRSPISSMIKDGFSDYIKKDQSISRILDLCSGSGCIGIAASYAFPDAEVDLVDISEGALEVAQINIEALDCLDIVTPIKSDLFSELPVGLEYDIIISNPPYVDAEDLESMPEEFAHEPCLALDGGADGLDVVGGIIKESYKYLSDKGFLVLEVGNSMLRLESKYSNFNFDWIDFDGFSNGVVVLSKADLIALADAV